jgi:hypothetical protein
MNKQELIDAISEKLSQIENEQIVLDEDNEVYLFDDDTEEELGECFLIEALSKQGDKVVVHMDCDYCDEWMLEDCSEYELNIIYDAFFGDDDEWDDDCD